MKTVVTQLTVLPEGEPIYSARATVIEVEDDAAGPFVVIQQHDNAAEPGKVRIDPDEWPAIRDAVGRMMASCAVLGE